MGGPWESQGVGEELISTAESSQNPFWNWDEEVAMMKRTR